jgi:ATP-binding cassette subfamily B multidrug efflux pump
MCVWKIVIRFLRPHSRLALLAPFLVLVEVGSEMLQPMLMARIVNDGIVSRQASVILPTGAMMFLLTMIGSIGGILSIHAAGKVSYRMAADMRRFLFRHVHRLPFSAIDRLQTGSIITRLTDDVTRVQQLVQASMRLLFRAPAVFVGAVLMTFSFNVKVAFVMLCVAPILLLFIFVLLKRTIPLYSVVQKKMDDTNSFLHELLSGIRVMKTYTGELLELSRFSKLCRCFTASSLMVSRRMVLLTPIVSFLIDLCTLSILWIGGYEAVAGRMNIGDVMACTNYMAKIMMSMLMASHIFIDISQADASLIRLNEIIEEPEESDDENNNLTLHDADLVFSQVCFSYDSTRNVLDEVSFVLPYGKTLAIVGTTGSGKSTLVSLLLRYYEVQSGLIEIGGFPLQKVNRHVLRHYVGVVDQNVQLFKGTVASNLRMGCPDATDEELWRACELAEISDFLRKMPEELDYQVEQNGYNLSGGQKQRIGLARTLLIHPSILIVDNGLCAVDTLTSERIWSNIKSLSCSRIIVAQRVDNVRWADLLLFMHDNGKADFGPYTEMSAGINSIQGGEEVTNAN